MTQYELDSLIYKHLSSVDEAFSSIRSLTASLKNPEDKEVNRQTFLKIQQSIKDAQMAYDAIDQLAMEDIDEEDGDNGYTTAYVGIK